MEMAATAAATMTRGRWRWRKRRGWEGDDIMTMSIIDNEEGTGMAPMLITSTICHHDYGNAPPAP
jgi:hypothetical protein